MFSFIKFYLLECFDYYIVANGRTSFLGLLPDITTIAHSEVFEGTIWTAKMLTTRAHHLEIAVYIDNHPNSLT